jgi:hypothetical protein
MNRDRSLGLFIGLALALAVAVTAAAAAKPPTLRLTASRPLTIEGARFKAFERVTVTVDRTLVKHVRAGAAGGFRMIFRGIWVSRCDGYSAAARGTRGSRATLSVQPLACPSVNPG